MDEGLISTALETKEKVEEKMEDLQVGAALDEIFKLLRRTNKYIDETSPWVLAKNEEDRARLATVLYNLLESIRIAAVLLESFLPETSEKILDMLNTGQRSLESTESFGHLETGGHVVKKAPVLFARIDEKEFFEQLEKDQAKEKKAKEKAEKKDAKVEPVANEKKPEITIDDFAKVELKVGTIIECKPHPKADRLLVEQIDLGDEVRQVVSGIAEHYKPEELVGKQVIVVTNLKPVKLRGVESQGMLLCAANDKDLSFVSVAKDMPNGTTVR